MAATLPITLALASCGGGSSCGAETQSFGITFANSAYSLKVGQAATVNSSITPESCRSSMTVRTLNGSLPNGMEFKDGNLVGTPTLAGRFVFQAYISAVDGYQSILTFTAPRSAQITITVAP
ncbi:hypothetical protein [Ideonella sp. A 288]|uniref:hypothetical protein n=1 Tax=Ideonella sp. A 288 TaxID=1962181 RepID=UPI0011863894|nr:hypothetical protein [Ideonella sp. A 288]